MNSIIKPKLRKIQLRNISGFHPAISDIAKELAELLFLSRLDVFSKSSIRNLLTVHPVHLVSSVNDNYFVFAGLRSYQLALVSQDMNEKFSVLVYPSLNESDIIKLAQLDLYGSLLLHSLGTKSVAQLEKIKNHIGLNAAESIAPGLTSTRSISRYEKLA